MKKLIKIKTLIFISVFISISIVANASMINNTNTIVKAEDEIHIEEREIITNNDILAKLNNGLQENEQLTEIPSKATILHDVNQNYIYQDPERFYVEDMTEDEIYVVISRIANGENVIFGDGVAPDYSSDNQGDWASGGISKTHQWLTARGFAILANEQSAIYSKFTAAQIGYVTEDSDWPDIIANGETIDTFNCHFYNYPTGTNYWWETTPTAKDKFDYWYNSAKDKYNRDDTEEGFKDLGKAIHYLSDIGSPVHTGDRAFDTGLGLIVDIAQGARHFAYESDADTYKTNFSATSGGYYYFYANNNTDYIIEVNAGISYNYYADTAPLFPPYDDYWAAVQYPLEYTQRDIAGLLYKFYLDTNNLCYH